MEGNSTDSDPQDQTENTTDTVSISHTYTGKAVHMNGWRLQSCCNKCMDAILNAHIGIVIISSFAYGFRLVSGH